jgi:hypothetical protein
MTFEASKKKSNESSSRISISRGTWSRKCKCPNSNDIDVLESDIKKYKILSLAFQMTSFEQNPSFLQLYFLDNSEREVQSRLDVFTSARQHIVLQLQERCHEINPFFISSRGWKTGQRRSPEMLKLFFMETKEHLPITIEEDIMLHQHLMRLDSHSRQSVPSSRCHHPYERFESSQNKRWERVDFFDGVAWPLVRCGLLGRDREVRGGTTLATPRERGPPFPLSWARAEANTILSVKNNSLSQELFHSLEIASVTDSEKLCLQRSHHQKHKSTQRPLKV